MSSPFENLTFEALHESFHYSAADPVSPESVFTCYKLPVVVDCDVEEAGYRELTDSLEEKRTPRPCEQQLLKVDNTIDENTVVAACDRKDLRSIGLLLALGWPIDKAVYGAASLLCTAVNDVELMHWLIKAGADVNARNDLDEPVLSIAIARGSLDVVHLLLTTNVDTRHGDLLHCAAQREDQNEGAELVHILVERGADTNSHRYNNAVALRWRGMSALQTPLHIACRKRNLPVAKALLDHGADPRRRLLKAGELVEPCPLDKAIEINDHSLVNLMQEYL